VDQKSIVEVADESYRELGRVAHNIYHYSKTTHGVLIIIVILYV
jgi:hypothetical protein